MRPVHMGNCDVYARIIWLLPSSCSSPMSDGEFSSCLWQLLVNVEKKRNELKRGGMKDKKIKKLIVIWVERESERSCVQYVCVLMPVVLDWERVVASNSADN